MWLKVSVNSLLMNIHDFLTMIFVKLYMPDTIHAMIKRSSAELTTK